MATTMLLVLTTASCCLTRAVGRDCFGPFISTPATGQLRKTSDIYDVIDEIFAGYKPYARPVKSSNTVTVVSVGFDVLGIDSLDEKRQTLSQNLFLKLIWMDEHLTWNRSQHGDLANLVVPQEMIWLPDVVVSPFAGMMQPLGFDDLKVVVESDGRVTWQPSGLFTTNCNIDITYYPFDTQTCALKLQLWTSNITKMLLQLLDDPLDWSFFSNNTEWDLLSLIPLQRNESFSGNLSYSEVELRLVIRRRPMFLALTLVLPTMLLAFLSTLVFALPAQSGEKTSVCVTVFLTFVLSLSIMLDILPHSSLQISVHVIYLSLLSACSAVSVFLSLVVLRLDYQGVREMPVTPLWARFAEIVTRYRRASLVHAVRRLCQDRLRKDPKLQDDGAQDCCDVDGFITKDTMTTSLEGSSSAASTPRCAANAGGGLRLRDLTRPDPDDGEGGGGQPSRFEERGIPSQARVIPFPDPAGPAALVWEGSGDVHLGDRDRPATHPPHPRPLANACNGDAVPVYTFGRRGSQTEPGQRQPGEVMVKAKAKDVSEPTSDLPNFQGCSDVAQSPDRLSRQKASTGGGEGANQRRTGPDRAVTRTNQRRTGLDRARTRTNQRQTVPDRAVTWRDVAESLDFVLFRFFLGFVCVITALSFTSLTMQYNVTDTTE